MSEYASKLSSIAEKRQKLLEEEQRLIEKRKQEIALLAEKAGLLTLNDATLTGLFQQAQKALHDNPEQLKAWERQGENLSKAKRNSRTTEENPA